MQEQTLDADQKKLALGATTVYQVIQDQRDLTTAAAAEVTAQATYAGARVQLDVATGLTLANNNVEIDEAKAGRRVQRRTRQFSSDAQPVAPDATDPCRFSPPLFRRLCTGKRIAKMSAMKAQGTPAPLTVPCFLPHDSAHAPGIPILSGP